MRAVGMASLMTLSAAAANSSPHIRRSSSRSSTEQCALSSPARGAPTRSGSLRFFGISGRAGGANCIGGGGGGGGASTLNPVFPATHRHGPFDAPAYMGASTPYVVTTSEAIARLEGARLTHAVPGRVSDHLCIRYVRAVRWVADKFFRERYVHRGTMLVTVACCPALAAAAVDHLAAIWRPEQPRRFRAVAGEAENHQTHLAILGAIVKPSVLDRCAVTVLQLLHFALFFLLQLVSPRVAHRLAAYFSEEAAVILTHLVNDIDTGKVADAPAPPLAVHYWGLEARRVARSCGGGAPSIATSDATGAKAETDVEEDLMAGVELESAMGDASDSSGASPRNSPHADPTTAAESAVGRPSSGASCAAPTTTPTTMSGATLRDVALLMRADNMLHCDAQHKMADEFERRTAQRTAFE